MCISHEPLRDDCDRVLNHHDVFDAAFDTKGTANGPNKIFIISVKLGPISMYA